MLLWTTLLCLLSANAVVSQFAKPEVLANYNPKTALRPSKSKLQGRDGADNLRLIRGLLMVRQSGCPSGYGECTNPAGRCCPLSASCCQGDGCCRAGSFCYSTGCCPNGDRGCEGNSCCEPGQTCCDGGGCCDPGYECAVVDGQRGCCPTGEICTGPPECTTPGYVLCPGEDFCCPPGAQCFRDSDDSPKCRIGSSGLPPSLTNTNTDDPTATFIPPTPTTTTRAGPSTAILPPTTSTTPRTSPPTPTSTSDTNSDNSGLTSSALSIVADAFLTLFTGVGVFAYLF